MATHPESLDDTSPPKPRGLWRLVWRHLPGISFSLMVVLLLTAIGPLYNVPDVSLGVLPLVV